MINDKISIIIIPFLLIEPPKSYTLFLNLYYNVAFFCKYEINLWHLLDPGLPSCLCVSILPMKTECNCTKKAHCPNCNLVCRVTCVLVKETNDFLGVRAHNLWWSKLQLKVPSLFVSYQRARCNKTHIFISFYPPTRWTFAEVLLQGFDEFFLFFLHNHKSMFSC